MVIDSTLQALHIFLNFNILNSSLKKPRSLVIQDTEATTLYYSVKDLKKVGIHFRPSKLMH
ncbi:hypothetical protein NC651_034999 [Populus alba x Populus x berolinensis]|nr:hypothetical protein NC651_034999 [Populus alba x Populus x berolinensis]